ncbi:Nucleolar RNA helicase 2 [Physocladia obscura]|uniref:RNA helicase n=1 Tax=Physocladia obscura TaxID=109957 RepID=A0AAD5XEC0_9FUNG|nr:Nucleolar RNA helicase 2 [Physocladia obscura]
MTSTESKEATKKSKKSKHRDHENRDDADEGIEQSSNFNLDVVKKDKKKKKKKESDVSDQDSVLKSSKKRRHDSDEVDLVDLSSSKKSTSVDSENESADAAKKKKSDKKKAKDKIEADSDVQEVPKKRSKKFKDGGDKDLSNGDSHSNSESDPPKKKSKKLKHSNRTDEDAKNDSNNVDLFAETFNDAHTSFIYESSKNKSNHHKAENDTKSNYSKKSKIEPFADLMDENSNKIKDSSLEFSSYNLTRSTIDALVGSGRKNLFPIQAACFKTTMAGNDVLGRARTGTGKTLAFALPIVETLKRDKQNNWNAYSKRGRVPLALVMAPTRELANQVFREFENISAGELKCLVIYGGSAYESQITSLRAGVDIVIGTPGRLIDHVDRGNIKLHNLKFMVIDECDMMVDVGFAESMEKILEQVFQQKGSQQTTETHPLQTLLFSATVPDWITSAIAKFMKPDFETIDLVGTEKLITSERVEHFCIPSRYEGRADMLGDIVAVHGRGNNGRTIVFVETRNEANELGLNAKLQAFGTQVLHGDIQQSTREASIQGFRDGKFRCLVTTNVCARGVDIPEVDLVINCEPPADVETYVHRSGRTGRAGKSGICVTFYKPNQEWLLGMITSKAGVTFKKYGAPQPKDIVKNRCSEFMDTLKTVHPEALAYFTDSAESLLAAYHNDPVLAVSSALAVICNTTKPFPVRSLMSAADGFVTVLFKAGEKLRNPGFIKETMKKHHPDITITDAFGYKLLADGTGMLVDIKSEKIKELDHGKFLLGGVVWAGKGGIELLLPSQMPDLLDGTHTYTAGQDKKKGGKTRNNAGSLEENRESGNYGSSGN